MKINLHFAPSKTSTELNIYSCFNKTTEAKPAAKGKTASKSEKVLVNNHWPEEVAEAFSHAVASKHYKGDVGETFALTLVNGQSAVVLGLGDKSKLTKEILRRQIAHIYKAVSGRYEDATLHLDGFLIKGDLEDSLSAIVESLHMTSYVFDRHLSTKKTPKLQTLVLLTNEKKTSQKKFEAAINEASKVGESITVAKNFVNEAPNILNSEVYAKEIEKDAKNLKNVKVKVLGVPELKKENMGMFLSVNAGSAYGARLVHLTYTPKKATSKTKHIALVGKGLTFDTGGYSLKPGASMMNMKFDMAGSATVYAAFRAAVLMELPVKISCYLGMTDNAVNEKATMPDSIVKARNGKTVEILNTDAEGRLVLGDVVNYACDSKPDALIDAATLTGAILVALGNEVCGLFSNNQKLADSLLKSAKNTDEYMWQMPIIDEHRNDMKAIVADLKNIGASSFGGSAKGAAFIENFVEPGIAWAHLDIAGIGDSQGHLPYCSAKGASGLVIRTLVDYLKNV
ncbi:MAG: leucyl aminopeptidase family protein [Bdellovibrionales bacterium]|nr:leucyl aminopeptidase family protein [Bdellovibrionales bacterium]